MNRLKRILWQGRGWYILQPSEINLVYETSTFHSQFSCPDDLTAEWVDDLLSAMSLYDYVEEIYETQNS